MFYQAWEKYRFFVAYERDEDDRLSALPDEFCRSGHARAWRTARRWRDESLLFYCGLFSLQPRSAAALEQVLADYFDVPVEIEQFVGAWRPLDPSNQCRMEGGVAYSDQLGMGSHCRRRDLGAAIAGAHPARSRCRRGSIYRFCPPETRGRRSGRSPRSFPGERSSSRWNWC